MFGVDSGLHCAWCGSTDTYFKHFRAWEEDERGNTIEFTDLSSEYSARDELWWCNKCEDGFVVDIQSDGEQDITQGDD